MTLAELDDLGACELVVFEAPRHPLMAVLGARGVPVSVLDGALERSLLEPWLRGGGGDGSPASPPAASLRARGSGRWALVADPASVRILELARRGATVSSGASATPDSLTAAHAAPILRRAAARLGALTAVMARLRSSDGCPWDREQTHGSLEVNLLEEAYEVIDAIETGAVDAELREELGDVLLQVAFHARIAAQDGRFDLGDVAGAIVAKLVNRHPHVFGDRRVSDAAEVLRNWEAIKSEEKGRTGPFEDIPESLPALLAAAKTQKRAARLGWHADEATARARLSAALEGRGRDAVGSALFWLVALARSLGVDAESALRAATQELRDEL